MAKIPQHVAKAIQYCDEAILEIGKIKAALQSDSLLDDLGAMALAANNGVVNAIWWSGAVWGEQVATYPE